MFPPQIKKVKKDVIAATFLNKNYMANRLIDFI